MTGFRAKQIVAHAWSHIRAVRFFWHARAVFGRTKYSPLVRDVWALAANMGRLRAAGLQGLNDRLLAVRTNIFDTIAEHNFACVLLRRFGPQSILYEPSGY